MPAEFAVRGQGAETVAPAVEEEEDVFGRGVQGAEPKGGTAAEFGVVGEVFVGEVCGLAGGGRDLVVD